MSLFVKHVADKQQFHVTIPCFSLTLRRLPPGSSHAISVKAFRNNERGIMRPTDKTTADNRSVQPFAIIKNTGHGNCFTLAVFTLELEMD